MQLRAAWCGLFFLFYQLSFSQSMFANSSFETGTNVNCNCPTGYVCANDAGRVVSGFHPVFVVGNQGCIGGQNYFPQLGARTGSCCGYFYAGLDRITSPSGTFAANDKVCVCVWYCGPQGAGASGQNTANCYFRIGVDGIGLSPNILVPVNTGWTQYCYTATVTAGAHTFCVMAGGAAQYSIWTDDFTVNICNTLPIELSDFKARYRNGTVALNWKTETETNNDFFTVERSRSGNDFTEVSKVKGAGTSSVHKHYSAYDIDPYKGVSYYRIKQTDFNGNSTYSHLAYVNSESEFNFSVYPNPSSGAFKIDVVEDVEATEAVLMNVLGQVIYKQQLVQGQNDINFSDRSPGIYNLIVYNNDQKVYTTKLTIE